MTVYTKWSDAFMGHGNNCPSHFFLQLKIQVLKIEEEENKNHRNNFYLKNVALGAWRDSSVLKSAYWTCRGPGVQLLATVSGGSQPYVTPITRDQVPSSVLW